MEDNTEGRFLLPKTEDWIYAASAIDYEGTISLSRSQNNDRRGRKYYCYGPHVIVGNTNPALTNFLFDYFGGLKQLRVKPGKWKDCWIWTLHRTDKLEWFITGIRPYLKMKIKQADTMLEYLAYKNVSNPEMRDAYHLKFKALNKKGKPVETNTPSITKYSVMKIESELASDSKRAPMVTLATAVSNRNNKS